MYELDKLIEHCYNQYTKVLCNGCSNGNYCINNICAYGSCSKCLDHILHSQQPQFHYPCKRITYYYTLRFFDRFASEIKRFFNYCKPQKDNYYFVSLGCGPGSELYGIVEGLRHCLGNQFNLKFRGYDLENVWNEVQTYSKNLFANTNCDVDFYCKDMFLDWQDTPDCHIDVLVMNYLLSDSQKYMSKNGTLIPFLDDIVDFVVSHRITIIMCNDIRLYGYSGLDSGIKCMNYINTKLKTMAKNVKPICIAYPNDPYIPNNWYKWKDCNVLFNTDIQKTTIAGGWTECRSKYIVTKIEY